MLQSRGYGVIPVNPSCDELLGVRCYASLADVPGQSTSWTSSAVLGRPAATWTEVIEIGASAVWMQLGVIDEAAAATRLGANRRARRS